MLDIFFKLATVVIALTNLLFVRKFFYLKNQREDLDKEKDRRINWLKTLVLDHSLDSFYSFFDSLEIELNMLKRENLTIEDKRQVDDKIGDQFILLRRKFTDTLIAVDDELYKSVLKISDTFQAHLTDTIFDKGINLAHPPKFQELVQEKLTISKTEIIKVLFGYRG